MGDYDDQTLDANTALVYYDREVKAGDVGRFSFVLRNKDGL